MWEPRFGALPVSGGVRFRVWAPAARELRLVLHGGPACGERVMAGDGVGLFELTVPGVRPGQRYSYRLDGSDQRPDPASRFQPDGVHGPSEVIDPAAFEWTDEGWMGLDVAQLVIYELHTGTFTRRGTFAAVRERLGALRDLGVTAIELMPVAAFAGSRNWGYDGVALFAPSQVYGRPDDLRALVDAAHATGLGVILDVVYNHLGPEGAYISEFERRYFVDRHRTPWGAAVNLDGPGCDMVREFITDSAVHWVREYHLDGLRFDATHALVDDTQRHFMRELAAALRRESPRRLVLHAEDDRNLAAIVTDTGERDWNFDGVWADDFHHVIRRMLAGDSHGYFSDYLGTMDELARTIRQGWLFTGEYSRHAGRARGTDPSTVPLRACVICLQNHDQIGNRAFGDRLHHTIEPAAWRAATAVLLTAPMTPLIFMGQEWAASTPFQYFTDLEPSLGRLVTYGRRHEFRDFPEFAGANAASAIPDPQSAATFERSCLDWSERARPECAGVLALYAALLRLRHSHRALSASEDVAGDAVAADGHTLVMRRIDPGGDAFWIVARLREAGRLDLRRLVETAADGTWRMVLSTEEERFTPAPQPPALDMSGGAPVIDFVCPSALIFHVQHG